MPSAILFRIAVSPDLRTLYLSVWSAAAQIATEQHRAITAEDLRHACSQVALGRQKSCKQLDNRELDRVVALFRILADPDDLDAVLAYLHPQNAERKRMEWWIENRCLPGYVHKLCHDEYGTVEWQSLTFDCLRALHMTLKHRPHAWRPRPARPDPAPALDPSNAPF